MTSTCAHPGCRITQGLNADALCAWHDPERRRARKRAGANAAGHVRPDDLPVAAIETMEDALKMAKWLPVAIATGLLGGREASSLVAALKEFRMTAADAGLVSRFEDLQRRLLAAKAKGLDV